MNIGIADKETTLPFYRNHRLSVWSSFDKVQGTRNNTPYDVIDVHCTTTRALFEEYGVPYYLKVDIEGYDYYCLNDLPTQAPQPNFVSCEANDIEYLTTLKNKGYSKFKIINQADHFKPLDLSKEHNWIFGKYLFVSTGIWMRLDKFIPSTYLHGSSGPFAEKSFGAWKDYDQAYKEFSSLINNKNYRKYNTTSWFDFHAKIK